LRRELKDHPANRAVRRIRWMIIAPLYILSLGILIYFSWANGAHLQNQFVLPLIAANWISTAYLRGRTHAPFVYLALREFGHDICPNCGYDLRKLPVSVSQCPECGALREPLTRATRIGYDTCFECGNSLRDLGEAVKNCPACGAARETKPAGEHTSRESSP
jgi:ssDNA-binding Zn-finger/Zn-ribbon topoisomerase 1